MELQSDRGRITWRDVKKAAITAVLASATAIIGQSFNFDPMNKAVPFFHLPTWNNLAITGGAAFTTFAGDIIRRFSTDQVKSAKKTIQKAEEKQIKKQQLI
jgi:hypothetical protein